MKNLQEKTERSECVCCCTHSAYCIHTKYYVAVDVLTQELMNSGKRFNTGDAIERDMEPEAARLADPNGSSLCLYRGQGITFFPKSSLGQFIDGGEIWEVEIPRDTAVVKNIRSFYQGYVPVEWLAYQTGKLILKRRIGKFMGEFPRHTR